MQRLTGLDAAFFHSRRRRPTCTSWASRSSTRPRRRRGSRTTTCATLLEARLHLLPPFRRRLVEVPFGLHVPIWIEDPDFDLDYHVRRAALPAPGGAHELAAFTADVAGPPARPDAAAVGGVGRRGPRARLPRVHREGAPLADRRRRPASRSSPRSSTSSPIPHPTGHRHRAGVAARARPERRRAAVVAAVVVSRRGRCSS